MHQRQIIETLTPEQRGQVKRLRVERGYMHWGRGGPDRYMMGRRGDGGPGGPTMRGPGKTFAQLDLSDEQSVKPDALMELQHEEMQSLVKKHREAMENVLTKAQRAELERIKDDAFYHRVPRRAHR